MLKNKKSAVILILAIGLFVRFIRINQPLSEFATRQVETAMIARNFYAHGFNILFPELDLAGKGGGPGIVTLEIGIMPFITAVLYKIFGGVHEFLGRSVSVCFWLGSAVFLYKWFLFFGRRLALYGLVSYTFLPLSIILGRTFQPEMAMVFFSVLGLYFLTAYNFGRGEGNFWAGVLSIGMAVLLKITAVCLILPSLFLLWTGNDAKRRISKIFIACLAALSPSVLWYSRGYLLSKIYISEFSSGNWSINNWFNFNDWVVLENWRSIFQNLFGIIFTPIGISLFCAGFFLRGKKTEQLFYYWIAGLAPVLLLFFHHARTHVYYWVLIIPPASFFIAKALRFLDDIQICRDMYRNRAVAFGILSAIVAGSIFFYVYPAYRVPAVYRNVREVSAAVRDLVPRDAIIVASCSTSPYFLYYCNRRGWDFWINDFLNEGRDDAVEVLRRLKEQNARYFISAHMGELNKNTEFKDYLYSTYKKIWEKEGMGVIFDLHGDA